MLQMEIQEEDLVLYFILSMLQITSWSDFQVRDWLTEPILGTVERNKA